MSPVEHPIVSLLQIPEWITSQAKRFPEQALSSITANRGRGDLSRDGYAQPVIVTAVGQYKSGNQRALITLAFLIDLLKLAATPQIAFHGELVMRRGEPLSSFSPTALQNKPSVLGCHPGSEAMGFGTPPVVWLKCSLRHSGRFPLLRKRQE